MSGVDVDQLLTPVSAESPSGENLEYDPSFAELERAAAGEPERYSGKEVIPAKEPGWKDVRRLALEILARSKDLRVAVQLTQAETALDGIAGLSAAVSVVRGLVDRFWDDVYPRLETDGEYDPVFRINALAPLSDLNGLIGVVRKTYLVEAKSVGRFSFRDLEVAEQRTPPSDGEGGPSLELLLGALNDAGGDYARAKMESLQRVCEDLRAIETVFTERTTDKTSPDFTLLDKILRSGIAFLGRGVPSEAAGQSSVVDGAGGDQRGTQTSPGEIRSREDVKRILEQICDFLQRTEPSNPAPILLHRARRLLDLSFIDIIQDLAPESLAEIEKLAGTARAQSTAASQ
jgi:type VI secretion system protein ImpA